MALPPSETLSLAAVPLSLPVLVVQMLRCSCTEEGSDQVLAYPYLGKGFCFSSAKSDTLSHTRINNTSITVSVCLEKMYLNANVAGCHHVLRNVVEIEMEKI